MNNVSQHPTAIWNRLKKNADAEQSYSAKAREHWFEISRDMADLRDDYPSKEAFGAALIEHGIEYDYNTRAAFINLGKLSQNAFFDALDMCKSRSPRLLWDWVKERAKHDDYFKPEVVGDFTNCEIEENISETIETPVEKAEMEETISRSTDDLNHVTQADARNKLFEVFPKDKDSIKKAYSSAGGGNPGWKEEFIDIANRISDYTGLSPSKFGNNFGPHAIFHNIGAWAFLKPMCGKFNKTTVENILNNWKHLVDLDEELELSDDKSAKFASEWWKNNVTDSGYDPDAAKRIHQLTQQYMEDSSKPRESKFTRVMGTVRPIIAYGVTIWDESSDIDKDVAFNVYQFWSSIDSTARKADTSPSSRGRSYQGDTSYLRPLTNNQAASVWYKIATAMIDHPDKESECSAPSEFVVS